MDLQNSRKSERETSGIWRLAKTSTADFSHKGLLEELGRPSHSLLIKLNFKLFPASRKGYLHKLSMFIQELNVMVRYIVRVQEVDDPVYRFRVEPVKFCLILETPNIKRGPGEFA